MTNKEICAAMATRDLMSATLTISELPCDFLKVEADDIELAWSKLGRIISHIRETARAA